jgi:hypothetical protein
MLCAFMEEENEEVSPFLRRMLSAEWQEKQSRHPVVNVGEVGMLACHHFSFYFPFLSCIGFYTLCASFFMVTCNAFVHVRMILSRQLPSHFEYKYTSVRLILVLFSSYSHLERSFWSSCGFSRCMEAQVCGRW